MINTEVFQSLKETSDQMEVLGMNVKGTLGEDEELEHSILNDGLIADELGS